MKSPKSRSPSPKRSPVRIGPLNKGTLSQFGYATHKNELSRHRALAQAVRKYGALAISRKLNAVAVLTKNTSPKSSTIFKKDRKWVAEKYIY